MLDRTRRRFRIQSKATGKGGVGGSFRSSSPEVKKGEGDAFKAEFIINHNYMDFDTFHIDEKNIYMGG